MYYCLSGGGGGEGGRDVRREGGGGGGGGFPAGVNTPPSPSGVVLFCVRMAYNLHEARPR